MPPKVSVLWINYNSSPFLDVALESLKAVEALDYPNVELVIVDNGSTDGSYQAIKNLARKLRVEVKLWRSDVNLGFAEGNNVAYRLADPESEYIVLLNNDAIPYPGSLSELVEFLQAHEDVGGAQGIIYSPDGTVHSAGVFVDELLMPVPVRREVGYPIVATYPAGNYCVLKRRALRAAGLGRRLFIGETFAYFDDLYVGLKLWSAGLKVVALPVRASVHYWSMSFGRVPLKRLYYSTRSRVVRIYVTNSRWRSLLLRSFVVASLTSHILTRAFLDGLRLAKRIGEHLDLYRAPVVRVSLREFLRFIAVEALPKGTRRRKFAQLREEERKSLYRRLPEYRYP